MASPTILAYITDLFFQAKVAETAQAIGVEVSIATSLYHFLPRLEEKPSAVLIDLDAKGISPTALIAQIKEKAPQLPVIIYGPHVEKERMERVRAAGADHVLSKAKFSRDLAKLLKKFGVSG